MATILPANRLKKLKPQDGITYTITPNVLADQSNSFALSTPTLSADSVIATSGDINTLSIAINSLSANSLKYKDLGDL